MDLACLYAEGADTIHLHKTSQINALEVLSCLSSLTPVPVEAVERSLGLNAAEAKTIPEVCPDV